MTAWQAVYLWFGSRKICVNRPKPQDARTSIMCLGTESLRSNQDVQKEACLFMRKNAFQKSSGTIFPSKSSFTLFKRSFFQRAAQLRSTSAAVLPRTGKTVGWMKGPVEFHNSIPCKRATPLCHDIVYLFPTFHKTVQKHRELHQKEKIVPCCMSNQTTPL